MERREEEVEVADLLDRLRAMLVQGIGAGKEVRAALEPVQIAGTRATALALVFSELLQNALEHGGDDRGVELSRRNGDVVLAIADDGSGIEGETDSAPASRSCARSFRTSCRERSPSSRTARACARRSCSRLSCPGPLAGVELWRGLSDPLVVIDTRRSARASSRSSSGTRGAGGFVEANEAAPLAYKVYFDEDGTRTDVLQIHRTRRRWSSTWSVAGPLLRRFTD